MGPTLSKNVRDLSAVELRKFIDAHQESEFALIDVRQPEEYASGHIPGALLFPLNELEANAEDLRRLSGRSLVFYCRGGARSARASMWAAQVLGLPGVHNLLGGFSAWEGPALAEFPRVRTFDLRAPKEVLLRQALELEKGTHRLYERLVEEYPTGLVGDTLSALLKAEQAHGRLVFQVLNPGALSDFESTFGDLSGDILENGMSFDVALQRARELREAGPVALLELVLEIELGAYDLYKSVAASVSEEPGRHVLEKLAQEEKAHVDHVLAALGKAVGSPKPSGR